MNDRLRLKMTDICNRNCKGCCNKYYPDVEKFDIGTTGQYKQVFLTGGEPLMNAPVLKAMLAFFRNEGVETYIYSSMCRVEDMYNWSEIILEYDLGGITFTIHEAADIPEFIRMDRLVNNRLSLRLNLFDHFEMDFVPKYNWLIKPIHWMKNCPVPNGEDFRRL